MTSLVLPVLLLAACAKKDKAVSESQQAAATVANAPAAQRKPPVACAMVTPAEMSIILGSSVVAEPHEGSSNQTQCIYKGTSPHSPYVEFTVNWGDGEGAMEAQGMLGQHQAGLTKAYPGVGDQAYAVGPELMIRNGDDLVTLLVLGVTDAPATVKRIFDTAKPRM
ncbi:MAG TPA: hypothetical protein VII66_04775 [Gemmatimonadaceae bacterium]